LERIPCFGVVRGARPAKAIVMRFKLSQALPPSGFGQASDFMLILLLSTTTAVIGPPVLAFEFGDDQATVQQQQPAAENGQLEGNNQAKTD